MVHCSSVLEWHLLFLSYAAQAHCSFNCTVELLVIHSLELVRTMALLRLRVHVGPYQKGYKELTGKAVSLATDIQSPRL